MMRVVGWLTAAFGVVATTMAFLYGCSPDTGAGCLMWVVGGLILVNGSGRD